MKYRREIDGLRAVAVLPVILFHAGFKAFEGGFIGVDVFFVISGYLITTIILSDMNKEKFSIVTFYERRARRILPALFFVMLCCLPFAWLWLTPNHLKDFSKSLTGVAAFSSNILFWKQSGYFETAAELKPLLHTWSLSVEEQYYVLFPLFLMALWKLRKRWIFGSLMVVAVASLIAAQWGAYNYPSATFFLLPTRGWELAIGALIAFYFLYKKEQSEFITSHKATSEVLGLLGLALICYSIFAFDKTTPFPSLYALIPTIGTALIIIFSTSNTISGRLLSTKAMVGIGLISYSTYLWHQPLFVFARHRSLSEPSVTLLLALSVLSIALAYLSWRYVEMPFRNKQAIGRRQIFAFTIVGSIVFAVTGLAGNVGDGFVGRHPKALEMQELVESSELARKGCEESLAGGRAVASACPVGAANEEASFILVGDSHAQAIVSALDGTASRYNLSGLNYAFNSCPPLVLGHHQAQGEVYEICSQLRNDFFQGLSEPDIPEYVIMLQRWTLMMEKSRFNNQEGGQEYGEDYLFVNKYTENLGYELALEKDFSESVRRILSSGRKVVLIYPVPEVGWNVPDYLVKMYFKGKTPNKNDASTSYSVFKSRNDRSYEALDSIGEHKNLTRIYPERLFCNNSVSERCVSNIDGVPLYYDEDHLSIYGAQLLVDEIMQKTEHLGMKAEKNDAL